MTSIRHPSSGFTLVELAIVVTIIGLLLAATFKGQSLLRAGQVLDTIAIAKDISLASQTFKQRYHYLPGDFPVDQEITGLAEDCVTGTKKGDGNGLINVNESLCVPSQLILSGMLKGNPAQGLASRYGSISLIASARSNVNDLPARIQNVIEFSNLPCDVAQEIDAKLDDGGLRSGNIRANVACTTTTSSTDSTGNTIQNTVVTPYVTLAVPL